MHPAAFVYVARTVTRHPVAPGARVVEIGARVINGSVRGLFEAVPGVSYLGTDIAPGPGVDLVADGATLTLAAPADVVVCCEVLEHAERAPEIIRNAARMLPVGGRIIVTAAGREIVDGIEMSGRLPHSAVDGGPVKPGEFYRNVSALELRYWLADAGFEAIEAEYDGVACDVRATATRKAAA